MGSRGYIKFQLCSAGGAALRRRILRVLPCGEGFSGDVEQEDLKGCSVERDLWAVAEAGILRGCCVAKDLWVCHVEKNLGRLGDEKGSRGCHVGEDSEGCSIERDLEGRPC